MRWTLPSKTTPGTADASDYEEYAYDASGNLTSLRKRGGQVLGFAYDNLDRVTVKTVPDGGGIPASATRDVYCGHDLTGSATFARFESVSGEGLSWTHDGLGRVASSSIDLGGTVRTLSYGYDANNQRIQLAWTDGQSVYLDRDRLGRPYYARVPGLVALNLWYHDAQGRPASLLRGVGGGWGSPSSWGHDAVSRLASVAHAFPAATNDVTSGFGYNPASQIVSRTRDNDAYGHAYAGGNHAYAPNGQNQSATASTARLQGTLFGCAGRVAVVGELGGCHQRPNCIVERPVRVRLTAPPFPLWRT